MNNIEPGRAACARSGMRLRAFSYPQMRRVHAGDGAPFDGSAA